MQQKKDLGYLDFITHGMFVQANAIFSASAVRLGTIRNGALNSKVVIVGAGRSQNAWAKDEPSDMHPTPVGNMVGVELHANFAEAFLNPRVFGAVSHHMLGPGMKSYSAFSQPSYLR